MTFEQLLHGVPSYKQVLEREGLLVRRGVASLRDEQLVELAEALSDVTDDGPRLLSWDFGTIMRMKYDPHATNYLFSAQQVPLHWDGAFHVEPRYLLFFCDDSRGDGGETIFVNTELILRDVDEARVRAWEGVTLTYSTEKKAHYGGTFTTPVVRRHPFHGRRILRFAEVVETDLNPVHVEIRGAEDPDGFYRELASLVLDPRYAYRHAWRPGDILVVDNHSFIHGRAPLRENLGRSFRRVQIL